MTEELFRDDAYLKACEAQVVHLGVAEDGFEVVVDQTVFYPMGGGQPGDTGEIVRGNGDVIQVLDTRKRSDTGALVHHVSDAGGLEEGETVTLSIDWLRRYRLMRLHSCMHMLCAVIDDPVTGGSIRDDGTARLDFDMPEPPDKAALEAALNAYTQSSHPMTARWITDDELVAQPELVRTMSVKPPMGSGKVRLVQFEAADLQPCGGTHVADACEIGEVHIRSIKKKGRQNRRITVALVAD